MPYLEIEGIGPVLFERSKRAKRIVITVKREGKVRVAVPRKSSIREAEKFTCLKTGWIKKHLAQLNKEKLQDLDEPVNIDIDEANNRLINRINYLAAKHKFNFNRLAIKNQKSLWGSCSANNNISLNIKLATLPEELMDYVILHELVHTQIKNHSHKFWEELAKYVQNPKQQAAQLRRFRTRLN